ncbi:MAG TPA: DUF1861 family protein [Tepidisphaeraceae bacterium]|jgi:hypothetical protein
MAESLTGESIAKKTGLPTVRRELPQGTQARSCAELLAEFKSPAKADSWMLEFGSMGGRDVYNITAPFNFDGKTLLAGRVEKREAELSEIIFFEKISTSRWSPCFRQGEFHGLQDPCVTWAGNELVLGGVRYPVPTADGGQTYLMEFYKGKTLHHLRHFLTGPAGMKDIRFKQLQDGRVAVFSRPQGAMGGRGQIGFTIAPSWENITSEMIQNAPLFQGQFLTEEWGGANEVHQLANGHLGLLGHIARFDQRGDRHYYPMAFTVNPITRESSEIKIIAQRSLFPAGPSKRPDIADVVFSGGLVRQDGGTAELYAGVSDAAAAVVKLPDPFFEFEN